jgi:glutathione S-transferase
VDANVSYQLYYWTEIPGRGEYVRLALEEAGTPYVDVAREPEERGGGDEAIERLLDSGVPRPFAPPVLVAGDLVIAQTSLILQWLAPRHGLVPDGERERLAAMQHQLTIADLVVEVHDTHHPIAGGKYYEEQRDEARRRARDFVDNRLPKFLSYFEALLEASGTGWLIGDTLTYPDLSLFQTVSGLEYAFPRAMKRLAARIPLCHALCRQVAARPRIAAYLASPRRLPFNQWGIFRHYPELDRP